MSLPASLNAIVRRLFAQPLTLRKADAPARVRIVKAEVKRLSLCRRGKNGLTTLYKADGSIQLEALIKATADEGTLLAVMYAPERADADGHLADAGVVREMLHSLMRNGAQLDIEHDGKVLTKAQAYVAEAFTVQKSDPRFADWKNYDGTPAGDLTGAAAVEIRIEDPALRASRRSGQWDGISLFGTGEGVPEQVIIKSLPNPTDQMTPEQLATALAAFQVSLVKAISEAIKPPVAETKSDEAKAPALVAPVFKGNATSLTDLAAFEAELGAFELNKALASGTMTAAKLADLRKSLSEKAPSDAEMGIESGDSKEVRELKLRLFKAEKRSNAPIAAPKAGEKSQIELDAAEGLELAKSFSGEAKAVNAWRVH